MRFGFAFVAIEGRQTVGIAIVVIEGRQAVGISVVGVFAVLILSIAIEWRRSVGARSSVCGFHCIDASRCAAAACIRTIAAPGVGV